MLINHITLRKLTLLLLLSMFSLASASIDPVLFVDCVEKNADNSYTAWFGYSYAATTHLEVAIGGNNYFTGGGISNETTYNHGQTDMFYPGVYHNVFKIKFNGSPLTWHICHLSATAQPTVSSCPVFDYQWKSTVIGTNSCGSCFVNGTSITINNSGADIWGGSDNFTFYSQEILGDCEMICRVDGFSTNITDPHAKAGIMIRKTLHEKSEYAFIMQKKGNYLAFEQRTYFGNSSENKKTIDQSKLPYWLKLVRYGNNIYGYYSQDRRIWTYLYSTTINFYEKVYIGLAFTSHNSSISGSAIFDSPYFTKNIKSTSNVIYHDDIVYSVFENTNEINTVDANLTTPMGVEGKISNTTGSNLSNYYYYLKDHLGSTRAVIDDNGGKVASYIYTAYGELNTLEGSSTDAREKFTGKEFDSEGPKYHELNFDITVSNVWGNSQVGYVLYFEIVFTDGTTESYPMSQDGSTWTLKATQNYNSNKTIKELRLTGPDLDPYINYQVKGLTSSGNGLDLEILPGYSRTISLNCDANTHNLNQVVNDIIVNSYFSISNSIEIENEGSGLVYFGARYYDPEVGVWMSMDPKGQYLDPYNYCGKNPVNRVDLQGEFDIVFWTLVAVISYVSLSVNNHINGMTTEESWNPFRKIWWVGEEGKGDGALGLLFKHEWGAGYDNVNGVYIYAGGQNNYINQQQVTDATPTVTIPYQYSDPGLSILLTLNQANSILSPSYNISKQLSFGGLPLTEGEIEMPTYTINVGQEIPISKSPGDKASSSSGDVVRLYSSPAFAIGGVDRGLNHVFVYGPKTGLVLGRNGSSMEAFGLGGGDIVNSPYKEVQLPNGMSESYFIMMGRLNPNLNSGLYVPFLNDCHTSMQRVFKGFEIPYPGAPGGRIDWIGRGNNE